MNSNRRLRWGVLGYARIARLSVIPALRRTANAEFHALASRDPAKLAACRAEGPLAKAYGSYEDLIRDPEVEAVYIPLPNTLHREWALKAMARGKHVLCEKPMGMTAAECREMVVAAETHRVVLMEAFMYRYTPRTLKVAEIVRGGALGEIKQVNAVFRFPLSRPGDIRRIQALGGGSLYDVGCYPVNFVGLVADLAAGGGPAAGGLPERIAVDAVIENGVDENFAAVLRYRSGLMAVIQSGFSAHRQIAAQVVGTRGVLEVPDAFLGEGAPLALGIGDAREEIPVPSCDRYRLELEDFSAAVLEGKSPHFSLRETVRNAELTDRLLAELRRTGL